MGGTWRPERVWKRRKNAAYNNMSTVLGLFAVVLASQTASAADWEAIAKALDTGGNNLNNWKNANPPCGNPPFAGIICNGTYPAALDLSGKQLSGNIPPEIAQLNGLTSINLSGCNLNGAPAATLNQLATVQSLDLSNNNLGGPLTLDFATMTSLTQLILNNNLFTGGLPPSLGNTPQMAVLNLQYNQFQGGIPGAFENMQSLDVLRLDHNQLTGNPPNGLLYLQTKNGASYNFGNQAGPGFNCYPFAVCSATNLGNADAPAAAPAPVLYPPGQAPPQSPGAAQPPPSGNSPPGAASPPPPANTTGTVNTSSASSSAGSLPIIIGIAAGGCALLILAALLICVFCRKKRKPPADVLPAIKDEKAPRRTLSRTLPDVEAGDESLLANAAPLPPPGPGGPKEAAVVGTAAAAAVAVQKYQQSKSQNSLKGDENGVHGESSPVGTGWSKGTVGLTGNSAPEYSDPSPAQTTAALNGPTSKFEAGEPAAVGTAAAAAVAGAATLGMAAAVATRENKKNSLSRRDAGAAGAGGGVATAAYVPKDPAPVQDVSFSDVAANPYNDLLMPAAVPKPKAAPPPQALAPQPPIKILPPQKLPPVIPEEKPTSETDFGAARAGYDSIADTDSESLMSSDSRQERFAAGGQDRSASRAEFAATAMSAGAAAAAAGSVGAVVLTGSEGSESNNGDSFKAAKASAAPTNYGWTEDDEEGTGDGTDWEAGSQAETLQRFFTVQELSLATNDFGRQAKRNILGSGRYGTVYKARLPEGTTVAVKRLTNRNPDQTAREFKFEAEAFVAARHPNLVSLLGCCAEAEERMLVYEFVPNGSLESWLHGPPGAETLDWPMRMHLALGTARGLFHLHQGMDMKVVHRDVKASNVLIDAQWNAKLGDFALAKIMGRDQAVAATRVVGTFGCAAPEYMNTGLLTERSDVYSFGVLLLELFTGRHPIDNNAPADERELVAFVSKLESEGRILEAVDPRLHGQVPPEDVEYALGIALKCVDKNALKRPRMSQIVAMLESEDPSQRTDWIPRRPSAYSTPRVRDTSPAMTPSARDGTTPSYRMYDAQYYSPRVGNLVSPRVRDSYTGGMTGASPRVRDMYGPITGQSPRLQEARAQLGSGGSGYRPASPRPPVSPRAASPTAAGIIANQAMNAKNWNNKR